MKCSFLRWALEKDMILSVEPGIYFIPYLLEKGFKDEKISKYFVPDEIKKYYDFVFFSSYLYLKYNLLY